jgi:hypothetical protein
MFRRGSEWEFTPKSRPDVASASLDAKTWDMPATDGIGGSLKVDQGKTVYSPIIF